MPSNEYVFFFFWKWSNWWGVQYSELGLFVRGNSYHLRQASRRSETGGDHFVKGVQTVFHSISRPVATRGSFPIELSGTVTRLNWTIKTFPEEKQVISCHQFRSVTNPINMRKVWPLNMLSCYSYEDKSECLSSWLRGFDNWNLCLQFCATFLWVDLLFSCYLVFRALFGTA